MNILPEGEAPYRLLFDVTPTPVLVYSLESFAILDVNQAALATYGYTRPEFLSLTIGDLLTPDDFARVKAAASAAPEPDIRQEIRQHRKKCGTIIDVELNAYEVKMGGRRARMVTVKDITEQVQQERRLQTVENYHRLLFEHSPLPVFVFDHSSLAFLDVNETAVRKYGYTREEFLRLNLKDIRPAEDIPKFLQLMSLPALPARLNESWRHQKKDGTIIEVEIHTYPIFYKGREATVAAAHDVTTQRQLTEKLQNSERRLREIYEQATDAIYTHDLAGNLTSMNALGIRVLGYSYEELMAMNMHSLLSPEDLERASEMIRQKLAGELKSTVYEVQVITKSGEHIPVELSTTLMCEDGEPIGVQGIARIVAERKRVEDQLRQAQKMEAVGRLAGGIAHDFNNRLTAIQGFTDLLLRRAEKEGQQHYYLEQIKIASERAAELTRQLLTFSRKQVLHPKFLNLNELVSDWGNLVRVLLGENIAVHLILGSDIGLVKADPGQLEHVMMNLALNACDAMPNGGDFTITTTDLEISDLQAKFNPSIPPGEYVRLTVKDNGCGMSENTLSHLFEPFFTTKERGKGTGLGLFTAYGIIKQSGGYVEVKSTVGRGTTFFIYLPVVNKDELVSSRQSNAKSVAVGRETVLVVEDEPTVRKLVCEVLSEAGYNVGEAAQGADALVIAARLPEKIDLLVTDVRLPGMNGYELAERIKEIRPDMRVMFMSAYTDDPRVLAASNTATAAFLQKPFPPDELTRRVRELLDRSEATVAAIA